MRDFYIWPKAQIDTEGTMPNQVVAKLDANQVLAWLPPWQPPTCHNAPRLEPGTTLTLCVLFLAFKSVRLSVPSCAS
jgi:hypothetical protein